MVTLQSVAMFIVYILPIWFKFLTVRGTLACPLVEAILQEHAKTQVCEQFSSRRSRLSTLTRGGRASLPLALEVALSF